VTMIIHRVSKLLYICSAKSCTWQIFYSDLMGYQFYVLEPHLISKKEKRKVDQTSIWWEDYLI